jgi:hypothetical protein
VIDGTKTQTRRLVRKNDYLSLDYHTKPDTQWADDPETWALTLDGRG